MNRRRLTGAAAVWVAPSAVLLLITWAVYARYRIEVPPRVDAATRAAVLESLRAAVNQDAAPAIAGLDGALDGPLVVGVWLDGGMKARVTVAGDTLGEAVAEASEELRTHVGLEPLSPGQRIHSRIKVDLVVRRGRLLQPGDFLSDVSGGVLPALGMHPGLDGLGVRVADREVVLLPDELVRGQILTASQPLSFVPEFKIGLEFSIADKTLQALSGLRPEQYLGAERRYHRIRTDSFVEPPVGDRERGPVPLTRGLPPRPELTSETLRESAIAGGRYLVAHLADNGRYIYERNLTNGDATDPSRPGAYSIPRHAGTTYFLAELYRHTGESFLREPVERAFSHLEELVRRGGCEGVLPDGEEFACVIDRSDRLMRSIAEHESLVAAAAEPSPSVLAKLDELRRRRMADLGSTALAVVALAEYERATKSQRFRPLATRLTAWILSMQRANGSFRHLYVVPLAEPIEDVTLLYYSGEAALALARMYEVTGDERYRDGAHRALNHLVDWYDFFVGGFIYGEEHWTCIAAEAIWPAVKERRYLDFCRGYAEFLRKQQLQADDFPDQPDLAGAYGVSPFVLPHNTPAGSRSEAMISTYLLSKYHGRPDPAIREQVLAAAHYTLGQQIRPDSSWDVSARANGLGAMPGSAIDRVVRIDYVQHVCSALIRAIPLLDDR